MRPQRWLLNCPNNAKKFYTGQIDVQDITEFEVTFTDDKQLLFNLAALLDIFPAWFPIATHALKFGETHPNAQSAVLNGVE